MTSFRFTIRDFTPDLSALSAILDTHPSTEGMAKEPPTCVCKVAAYMLIARRLLRGGRPFTTRDLRFSDGQGPEHSLCLSSHSKEIPVYLCTSPMGGGFKLAHPGTAAKIKADIGAGVLSKDASVEGVFFCPAGVAWIWKEGDTVNVTAGEVEELDAMLMAAPRV